MANFKTWLAVMAGGRFTAGFGEGERSGSMSFLRAALLTLGDEARERPTGQHEVGRPFVDITESAGFGMRSLWRPRGLFPWGASGAAANPHAPNISDSNTYVISISWKTLIECGYKYGIECPRATQGSRFIDPK